MEENRLKPMVDNYNEDMFNRLYLKTNGLRRKLASEINPHRFGLQYEDILSFFDIKFIFVYNKYCKIYNESVLLGHIINALSFFKCRILRSAYTNQYSQTILSDDALLGYGDLIENPLEDEKSHYKNLLRNFMKQHLSDNAYAIFEVQLNPPPYILNKLNSDTQKIPDHILLEYFDLGSGSKAQTFINSIRKEIRSAINYAKVHFKNN